MAKTKVEKKADQLMRKLKKLFGAAKDEDLIAASLSAALALAEYTDKHGTLTVVHEDMVYYLSFKQEHPGEI